MEGGGWASISKDVRTRVWDRLTDPATKGRRMDLRTSDDRGSKDLYNVLDERTFSGVRPEGETGLCPKEARTAGGVWGKYDTRWTP